MCVCEAEKIVTIGGNSGGQEGGGRKPQDQRSVVEEKSQRGKRKMKGER